MYPISLKQIIAEKANVDKNNVPGTIKAADYNIEIAKFNCNLTPEGKEIGLFTFNNTDTKKQINMQVRGFLTVMVLHKLKLHLMVHQQVVV